MEGERRLGAIFRTKKFFRSFSKSTLVRHFFFSLKLEILSFVSVCCYGTYASKIVQGAEIIQSVWTSWFLIQSVAMTKIERNKRVRFNFWACSSILDLPASQSWQRNQWTLYDIWSAVWKIWEEALYLQVMPLPWWRETGSYK